MELFPGNLRENLKQAVASGALRREDLLETLEDEMSNFECDYMDIVEIAMELEERTGKYPGTIGELMDSLGSEGPDGLAPVAKL